MSQAPGLSGTPSSGHCSRAATSASCARSSARPMSRTTPAKPAISLADSIRQTASIAAWVAEATLGGGGLGAEPLLGGRDLGGERVAEVIGVEDLAELYDAAQRRTLGPFDGLVHRRDLPDRIAGDQLLRLGERTVDHPRPIGVDDDALGLAGRLEAVAGQQDASLGQLSHVLVHRREILGRPEVTRLGLFGRHA